MLKLLKVMFPLNPYPDDRLMKASKTSRFFSMTSPASHLRGSKRAVLAATLLAALASINAHATTYTFNGSISSDWAVAGNWTGSIAPTGNAFTGRRININGGSLVYSAAQETTVYNNTTDRAFVITTGSLTFSGGSFTSNNTNTTLTEDVLGNTTAAVSTLTVNGGNYTTKDLVMNFSGGNATTTVNVQSGTATIANLKVNALTGSTSTVNLDGGTLAVGTLNSTGTGTRNINFNGGTLRVDGGSLNVSGFTNAFVKAGGAVIDTNGNNATLTQDLLTDVVSTGGGLSKSGTGTLTLSGDNTYTGATTVNDGTLALGAADRIADGSSLVMAGGTFATGGFNETLGTLVLTATSTIDLGDGASALLFADSSGATWSDSISLSFVNFTEGVDSIRIGADANGLTEAQLSKITLNGLAASINSEGYLTAIPEPSTYAMIASAASLFLVAGYRRRPTRAQS